MYTNIKKMFNDELKLVTNITNFDIVQEHEAYEPRVRQPYIRVSLIPVRPTNIDNKTKRLRGIIQLAIYSEKRNPDNIVELIRSHFTSSPNISTVDDRLIIKSVEHFSGLETVNGWYREILFSNFEYYLIKS